jgi:hypothetical protein
MNNDNAGSPLPQPNIDYLARDFESFRRLLLDQMSVLTPTWTEESAADLGHALVELLAYSADYLSYYQDAAATEAYLSTARLRRSVRRHARLLDYFLHEGCNARVWVHITANAAQRVPAGALLLTQTNKGRGAMLTARDHATAVRSGALVFETLHALDLVVAHNEMNFHVEDLRTGYLLPAGAVAAKLEVPGPPSRSPGQPFGLKTGDVLIFEEILDPVTGSAARANPRHRHAVRLTRVFAIGGKQLETEGNDPQSTTIVQVEWAEADALPFPLYIGRYGRRAVTVARGNNVLADHGQRILHEDLPVVPEQMRYRPSLRQEGLTYRTPYHHTLALNTPASEAVAQEPRRAAPDIELFEAHPIALIARSSDALLVAAAEVTGAVVQAAPAGAQAAVVRRWRLQQDLLNSEPSAPDYVVEMEEGGRAYLRFGFGNLGQPPAPGALFFARYRVGNGSAGNIGPDTIAHMVEPQDERLADSLRTGVAAVRNPLPARGGVDPETLDEARLYAPEAFRYQERCVTEADYAERAERYDGVEQARAVFRQVGAWRTVFLYVRRSNFQPLTPDFRHRLRAYLESYRYMGVEIEIAEPYFAPLRVSLLVHLAAGASPTVVREKLVQRLGDGKMPDGTPALFAPANFHFGESVYQSQVIAAAMAVPGVAWVEAIEFCRADAPGLLLDEIPIGALEIAELRSSAADQAHGVIRFDIQEHP